MKKNTIEELLSNEGFITWVKNPKRESNLYWNTWMEDHPSEVEDLLLAKQIISDIRFKRHPKDNECSITNDEHFDRLLSNIFKEQRSKTYDQVNSGKNVIRTLNIIGSLAAALALVLVFALLLKNNMKPSATPSSSMQIISKKTQNGQKLRFMLPDKTFVVLNSASEMQYPREFKEEYRDIRLAGEAFFEVSKNENQPFRVHTKTLLIEAIGTSFDVKAFEDAVEQKVLLSEGKVRVSSLADSLITPEFLNPGEMVTYKLADHDLGKSTFDPKVELAWKNGILIFQESDLDDFKDQIERWYGVNINIKGVSENEVKISGYFENETLENVLQSLEFTTGIAYQITKEEIILFNKK